MVKIQNGVDPAGYERMTKAAAEGSKVFRNAVSSTGMFEVQQMRVNKATDTYTKALQKQKLSLRDLIKQRTVGNAAYREQLKLQSMIIRQNVGADATGKPLLDVIVPKGVNKELDTLGNRIGWIREQAKSASTSMVNWGKNTQWAGRQLMVGFTVPIAAFAAASGKLAYDVDQQMTRIQKVYNTTANTTNGDIDSMISANKELAQVRVVAMKTAEDAARNYGSSMTDTLAVQADLAATGKKGAELQASTTQVMKAATLGEMDYNDSLQATIAMQSIFHMNSKQLADTWNYMNSVENATSLSMQDFATAIPIAAGPIQAMGGDMKTLGILMTSMKERGVSAAQGANAIKASMQRLIRPSKQVREEFEALTGKDFEQLQAKNKGSLLGMLRDISDATEHLSKIDANKVFAGLFGGWQVTRMRDMIEGIRDLDKGIGQVSAAQAVGNQSTEQWARTSEQEISRWRKSVSGQFKVAVQTMKVQLAEMGKPFLEMATVVIKGLAKIVDAFNGLPHSVKLVLGVAAVLTALAGPVVMLTGLFVNLAGNVVKFGVFLTGLLTKFKLLDKESKAALLAEELVEKGFISETRAAAQLTAEIRALTEAKIAENAASGLTIRQHPFLSGGRAGKTVEGAATAAAAEEAALATSQAEKSQLRMNKAAAGTALSIGAVAAGMALTAKSSSGVAHDMGEVLTSVGLFAPALTMLGPKLFSGAKSIVKWGAGLGTAAEGAAATGEGLSIASGAAALLTNPITGIAALAVAAGAGIWIWHNHIEAARKEQERLNYSVNHMAEAYANATGRAKKEWAGVAAGMGNVVQQSKQLQLVEDYRSGKMKQTLDDYTSLPDTIHSNGTDEGTDRGFERYTMLKKQFIELQAVYGMSEKEALRNVKALMAAAGQGLSDQIKVVEQLKTDVGALKQSNVSEWFEAEVASMKGLKLNSDPWKKAAKDAADAFIGGFNKNASPEEAQKMIDRFAEVAKAGWKTMFEEMTTDPGIASALKKLGYSTAEQLRSAIAQPGGASAVNNQLATLVGSGDIDRSQMLKVKGLISQAQQAEAAFVQSVVKSNSALGAATDDNIKNFDTLYNDWTVKAERMDLKQAQSALKGLKEQLLQSDSATEDFVNRAKGGFTETATTVKGLRKQLSLLSPEVNRNFAAAVTAIAERNKIPLGKDAAETYFNITKYVKDIESGTNDITRATDRWAGSTKKAADALASIRSMGKEAMTGVQQDIADAAQEQFDKRMQAQTDARQKYWSDRTDAQSKAFDRQSRALDRKWQDRTDAANKYWDNRIKKVNDEITAEQKADEKRQKMFQDEIDRINKLKDAANSNIDFNTAINTGNLDEAARIQNDQFASAAADAIQKTMAKDADQSKGRQDKLQKQVDELGTKRDKYMKGLQRREDAAKQHLKNIQDAQAKSLKAQEDANMKALAAEQDDEKASFKDRLDLFMSYIATNKKDLERHMKEVGLKYDDFGDELHTKAKTWGEFFSTSLKDHITTAANELKTDKAWAQLGQAAATELVKGMGFKNWAQFVHFTATGEMTGWKKPKKGKGNGHVDNSPGVLADVFHAGRRHDGGWVEGGTDSRTGIARNTKGLHPTEKLILAKRKEFVVNERAAKKHGPLLEAMNSGRLKTDNGRPVTGIGGGFGVAGALTAGLLQGVISGFAKGAQNVYSRKQAEVLPGGAYAAGKEGEYGNIGLTSEQLKNAATIASVGSGMGLSKRDIEIGIMTAMTESGLRNLHYGDRDSQGLFQQRTSMGWGTIEEVTNPTYAATQFFNRLKGIGDRADISPWMAAQMVQRSAFSDGSNYQRYWEMAQAVFNKGLSAAGGTGAGFKPGTGGWHKPSVPGHGWANSHDYENRPGTPLYAFADSTVKESRAIHSGGSTTYPGSTPGYTSYGETILLEGPTGDTVRYAHLSPGKRFVSKNQFVKGGSLIGLSGWTGNASGPHTHFEVDNHEIAREWFASHGIGLKGGGYTMSDGLANLHKQEVVISPEKTKKLYDGIDRFADGGNKTYNFVVNANTNASADDIARIALRLIKQEDARRPQSRRG